MLGLRAVDRQTVHLIFKNTYTRYVQFVNIIFLTHQHAYKTTSFCKSDLIDKSDSADSQYDLFGWPGNLLYHK